MIDYTIIPAGGATVDRARKANRGRFYFCVMWVNFSKELSLGMAVVRNAGAKEQQDAQDNGARLAAKSKRAVKVIPGRKADGGRPARRRVSVPAYFSPFAVSLECPEFGLSVKSLTGSVSMSVRR